MPYEVIYLTGAPAAGKSSLTAALSAAINPLHVIEYGKLLTERVNNKLGASLVQSDIRTQSAQVITFEDVQETDAEVIGICANERGRSHIILDSHPVTKEGYGYRITPFSVDFLRRLSPTLIVMLYTDPDVTRSRIAADAGGRPQVTPYEAGFHNSIQASVAASYAIHLGIPVHLLDSARDRQELVDWFARRLST